MKTNKYLELLSDRSGHLNPNPNKKTDNHPDYGGYIKIDNKSYKISAWIKNTKDNKRFLSLKLSDTESITINTI